MAGFAVKYTDGRYHKFDTYEEAEASVLAVWSEAEIGHDGDISQGGEHTLVWASGSLSENDDGSRACASIVRLHDAEVQS